MNEVKTLTCTAAAYSYVTYESTKIDYSEGHPNIMGINRNRTRIIKFVTPDFIEISRDIEVTFTFRTIRQLRYALSASDKNWKNYVWDEDNKPIGDVSESYQIVSGMCTVNADGVHTINIKSEDLKPNTTYYLFLWDFNSNGSLYTESDFICINLWNGLVYIDNGTELAAYQAYIDNGSSWDMVIAYADNGDKWSQCS